MWQVQKYIYTLFPLLRWLTDVCTFVSQVTNLQSSVTKDDIVELFGDVGALKRAKVSTPGTAEVVFVNRSDAQKAVEIYHNRQLDGKAMKCQIVGAGG